MHRCKYLLSLLGALSASTALAQPLPEAETTLVLDMITIIGTGLATEVMQNPASITVLEGEALRRAGPASVAAMLRDVPGVHISEEGIERITIRGESARRIAILVDGQKLTDHTDYGQPVLVDPTTIERIEVVRGSSSVVSGSRAIGGVVNIITKTGADRPFALTGTAGWFSATDGYRASATASGSLQAGAGMLDYRLSAGRMEQGDRHSPEGRLIPSDMEDKSLSAHLGYRLNEHYFGLRAQRYDVAANVYIDTFDPVTETYRRNPDFTIELPKRELNKLSAFYQGTDLTPWLERLDVDIYRQTIDRLFHTQASLGPLPLMRLQTDSDDRQLTWGAQLRAQMRLSDRSRTVVGLEYEDDRLTSDKLTLVPMSATPVLRHDRAKISTFSVFAQHEIDLRPDLTFNLGGRWYDVSAKQLASQSNGTANPLRANSDSLAMVSAGLVWTPTEDMAFRANVSQGYIYPTLSQLFMQTYADSSYIIGNPELSPERSTTFELGMRLDRGGTMLDATLFHSDARDYIAKSFVEAPNIYQYHNIDRARAWGLELHAQHYMAEQGLTPYVTASLMRRELRYDGFRTTDSGTSRIAGRVGLRKDWQMGDIRGDIDLFLRAESKARLRNEEGALVDAVPGYGTLNLRGEANFSHDVSLAVELNNLTNRSYKPFDQTPGAERSINVFLTRSF